MTTPTPLTQPSLDPIPGPFAIYSLHIDIDNHSEIGEGSRRLLEHVDNFKAANPAWTWAVEKMHAFRLKDSKGVWHTRIEWEGVLDRFASGLTGEAQAQVDLLDVQAARDVVAASGASA